MSKFETLLINQTERQLSTLHDQSRYYAEWFRAERKLVDRVVVKESFKGGKISEFWESASFGVSGESSEIKGRWSSYNGLCGEAGLYVTNRIIRYKEPLTLKSLAVEIQISLKLAYNSEIWVITRGAGVKDPNSAIIKISKESDMDGIFIVFGSPIGQNSDFVFFKRQQIPEEKFDPNEEFTDIDLKINDNGDDRIYVSVRLSSFSTSTFQTYCSKFVPSLIENRIMVAGSGRNTILEKIELQQKERSNCNIILDASKRHQCCIIS